MFELREYIKREDLKKEPKSLFVFGDNMQRRGRGGQAYEMRGEPNAVGITTKRKPETGKDAYLYDKDFDLFIKINIKDITSLRETLNLGGNVVWPEAGIGMGRARLWETSPKINNYILDLLGEFMEFSDV